MNCLDADAQRPLASVSAIVEGPMKALNLKDCMCLCVAVHMVFGVSVAGPLRGAPLC